MIDSYQRISALFISDFANYRPYCNTVSTKPVVAVGTLLQLQLPAVSQLLFTAPVQVFVIQGLLYVMERLGGLAPCLEEKRFAVLMIDSLARISQPKLAEGLFSHD